MKPKRVKRRCDGNHVNRSLDHPRLRIKLRDTRPAFLPIPVTKKKGPPRLTRDGPLVVLTAERLEDEFDAELHPARSARSKNRVGGVGVRRRCDPAQAGREAV